MFQKPMSKEYQQMMEDLADHTYVPTLYKVYDGITYKGMASSEDAALALAVEFDNPAIYFVDKDNQTSKRVY